MSESAIEIQNLKFSYGRTDILKGVNLVVPAGSIFGFLGRNGAGKTTTIKLLLGLLPGPAGACRVLGVDPAADPIEVRRRVGYMAEDQQMYGWMRVREIVDWVAGFYPQWDRKFTDKLLDTLALPRTGKVKTLSKGQNSRLALLLALGHHPKVVILDDPTLGLDPIARKDFLRHVIGLLQANNVTVFFSSHLLYEIEPVADHVAILEDGVILKAARTDELREKVRRFVVPNRDVKLNGMRGVLDVSHLGDSTSIILEDREEIRCLKTPGQEVGLNLDEIFEAYVIGNRGKESPH